MFVTKEIGSRIENCIRLSHLHLTQLSPSGSVLSVGSGSAFYSGENSFFSQVVGWGFDLTEENFIHDIESIENFYRRLGHKTVDIELSSLGGNSTAHQLSLRGYVVSEINNISILDLGSYKGDLVPLESNFVIDFVSDSEMKDWARCVALGFECEEAGEQFSIYGKAPGITCFGATLNGEFVAGGTISIQEGICDLGITSTLLQYRGQGLQKALLNKRLQYAVSQKADIASVTTEPGSLSDLNVQKSGFKLAYTRTKFSRTLGFPS
jgi:GNAT superfamily N-acetyltransferase